jgi:tRNA(Ile)-lysidine synthase
MRQESLELRVRHFIREHRLLLKRQRLLLAVSGGADSVCLLHILVRLQDELNLQLHVAHLNHQLRGADAVSDARYVGQLARRLKVPATIEERDVKTYRARHHLSLEEAAREVRYEFLAQVAKSIGADCVAIGHTRDDHIETVLMHLIRGTGTRGLRGLQPISRWRYEGGTLTVIRPILGLSRQETADYCRQYQLRPRLDATNLSLSPLRNRIRLQLLPLLRRYNPRVDEALLRTARMAGDELAFLDEEGARLWRKIVRKQGDTIIIDRGEFLRLPLALKRHLLRMALEEWLGDLKDIETRHIEEVVAALRKPAGKKLDLPGGLAWTVDYDRYLLGPDPAVLSPFPVLENDFALKIPGQTIASGWRVTAAVMVPPPAKKRIDSNFSACFDLDKVGRKLMVRSRRRGDRFQPLGMAQTKKLGEFMVDAKIPRHWRERVPIVCSPKQIVWVVGWRIDDRVRVTEDTKRVLCLDFRPVATSE